MQTPRYLFSAVVSSAVVASLLFSTVACREGAHSSAGQSTDTLRYTITTFKRGEGDCSASSTSETANRCCIELSYPRLQVPVGDTFAQALADTVRRRALVHVGLADTSGLIANSEEQWAEQVLAEYRSTKLPDYSSAWQLERTVQIELNNSRWVTISTSDYTYLGGAHPNSSYYLETYDRKTGKKVRLTDLVAAKDMPKFEQLVAAALRKILEMQPNESWDDAGLFVWQDGKFTITDNIGLHPEGLRVYYNTYEIAPYALGAFDVMLTRDQLKGLLQAGIQW
jgi:hypothetical protein